MNSLKERNAMPKECAVCKQPAVVAARITRGEQTATTYLCENCAHRVGKKFRVEIVGSAIVSLPKGLVIDPAEPKQDELTQHDQENVIPRDIFVEAPNIVKMAQDNVISPQNNPPIRKIVCEMCGSQDLIKQDGLFICQYCGTKYTLAEARKMMIDGSVNVSGSTVKVDNSDKIENYYQLARRARENDNGKEAAKYYDLIRQEKPDDWEASFYAAYYPALDTNIAGISNAAIAVAKTSISTFDIIKSNIADVEKAYLLSMTFALPH